MYVLSPGIGVRQVNRLFKRFRTFGLSMGQPALVGNNVNHPTTRRDRRYRFRYVTFVEMMCPVFTRESLYELLDTFEMTRSGWGVDCVWARRFMDRRVGILDEVPVRHLKPRSSDGPYYQKLLAENVDAEEEMNEVLREHVTPGRTWSRPMQLVEYLAQEGVTNVHEAERGKLKPSAALLSKLGFGTRERGA